MPLIGFKDDSGNQVTFEEAWKLKSFSGLPTEVLYRIYLSSVSDSRPDGLSVTELLGCTRKAYLKKKVNYYDNPRFMYSLFRGTMCHSILEDTNRLYPPNKIISEKRYHRLVPGTNVNLSGKIDKYIIEDQCLDDYKTIADDKIEDLVKKLPEDYVKQTNIYAWILEGNGIPVKKIRIHFFSWKYCYTTGEKCLIGAGWYKPKWEVIPSVPLLRLSQVEDLLIHRVKDVMRSEIPPPIDADNRWMCQGCAFKQTCKIE